VSDRTRRLDHLLQEEISAIIRREVQDPRIGFVTITAVEVTPDLRHATVWASIIGDEAERRSTLQALGRAMPYVRHRLGALRLKRIPELHLREDDSAQRGTRVMQLLEQLEVESGEGLAAGDDPAALPPTPPPLPSPSRAAAPGDDAPLTDDADPGAEVAASRPRSRRRVDRVAVRKSRQRRGR